MAFGGVIHGSTHGITHGSARGTTSEGIDTVGASSASSTGVPHTDPPIAGSSLAKVLAPRQQPMPTTATIHGG